MKFNDQNDAVEIPRKKWWMTTLWLPFCWVAIQNSQGFSFLLGCLTGSPMPLVDESLQNTTGGGMEKPVDAIVLIGLLFCVLLVLFYRRDKVVNFVKKNIWLVGLVFFAGLSCVWSDFPFVSFRKYIRFFGTFSVSVLIFTEEDPCRYALRLIELIVMFFVLGSLACVIVYPDVGKQVWPDGKTYWYGITSHKNLLGQYAAIGLVFYAWRLFHPLTLKMQVKYIVFGLISGFVLLSSKSFSAFGLAIAAVALLSVLMITKKIGYLGGVITIVGIASIVSGAMFFSNAFLPKPLAEYFLEAGGKDATLTGRTDIWALTLEAVTPQMRIIGAGFDSFWMSKQGDKIRAELDWNATHAHNGYLNVLLQFGTIGCVLLFLFLLTLFVRVMKLRLINYNVFVLFLVFIFIALISDIDESNYAVSSDLYWLLLLITNSAVYYLLPGADTVIADDELNESIE